jgi:hypothetical protein
VTGKLFEYLASEQAILAIGPQDGDAAAILSKQAGTMVINFDTDVPWPAVIELTSQQISRKDTLKPYSRKELAKEMHGLLESIIKS